MITKEAWDHWTTCKRAAANMLRNSDKYIEANKDLNWDEVFALAQDAAGVSRINNTIVRVPMPPSCIKFTDTTS